MGDVENAVRAMGDFFETLKHTKSSDIAKDAIQYMHDKGIDKHASSIASAIGEIINDLNNSATLQKLANFNVSDFASSIKAAVDDLEASDAITQISDQAKDAMDSIIGEYTKVAMAKELADSESPINPGDPQPPTGPPSQPKPEIGTTAPKASPFSAS